MRLLLGSTPLCPEIQQERKAYDIFQKSMQQMRIYIKRYANLYSFRSASSLMMHFLMIPAFDYLEEMHLQESRQTFTYCYEGLQQISAGLFLAQAITQAIRTAAESKKITLPSNILAASQESVMTLVENVYSQYPAYTHLPAHQQSRLDSVLNSISELSVRDTATEPPSLP